MSHSQAIVKNENWEWDQGNLPLSSSLQAWSHEEASTPEVLTLGLHIHKNQMLKREQSPLAIESAI